MAIFSRVSLQILLKEGTGYIANIKNIKLKAT